MPWALGLGVFGWWYEGGLLNIRMTTALVILPETDKEAEQWPVASFKDGAVEGS